MFGKYFFALYCKIKGERGDKLQLKLLYCPENILNY
jgi:hypothetical protein